MPSAWDWSHKRKPTTKYLDVANGTSRSPDPNLRVRSGYLLRRLSPESRKIEFGKGDNIKVDRRLLQAMGRELGSIHGEKPVIAKRITRHLKKLDGNWLPTAVEEAAAFIRLDFRSWKFAKRSAKSRR